MSEKIKDQKESVRSEAKRVRDVLSLDADEYDRFEELFYKPIVGLAVLVIGSLGMVAPVQGGIGAYHFCVQMCMSLYGESKELGLSFAFIGHTAQTLLVIVVGVVSVIFLPLVTKWLKNAFYI